MLSLLQLPSRVLEVEFTTSSSNFHVEMNPSDVGNNDRYVVQEIIKVGSDKLGTILEKVLCCLFSQFRSILLQARNSNAFLDFTFLLPWDSNLSSC